MPVVQAAPASNSRFIQILTAIFTRQAREVLTHISLRDIQDGKDVDLSKWLEPMLATLRPVMLQDWRSGMTRGAQRIAQQLRTVRPYANSTKAYSVLTSNRVLRAAPYRQKRLRSVIQKAAVGMNFDLFNPRVLGAVDAATMHFCRETNDTAAGDLKEALAELRRQLKEGLSEGDALRALHRRVRQIFVDPARAFRIAATESRRAVEAGNLMAMKESGIVSKKKWLASSDACPFCLELDGEERELDEAFYIDPKGGPYARVDQPPRH